MKTGLLIIIVAGLLIASISGYVMYKQSECASMPGYGHNPRQNDMWDCLQHEGKDASETQYQIPSHVYEIWQSYGIVIHGEVGESVHDSPVTIKIEDEQGNLIEIVQIYPDESGRFIHGIVKHGSEAWENISSYTVTATYDHPASLGNDNISDHLNLDKDTIPLNPEQISQLSHDQVMQVIKEWNKIGGNSPFTLVSVIEVKDNYALGESMPFFVQKSGYGNPCHDQGVVVFNEDTQTRVATGFYLEACNFEQKGAIAEPYNYLVPYNQDIFAKLAPIMEPGNYIMIAGSDDDSKYKKRFTVSDSDYAHDYNVTYELQKGSKDNTQSMTVDLNSGKMTIRDADGAIRESSIDQDTLYRINAEIIESGLAVNPWSSHKLGDDCDTCDFGIMKVMVDDVVVHHLIFDETNLTSPGPSIKFRTDSSYFFSLVDCIAAENGFDTFWISDSEVLHGNEYEECDSIGGSRDKNTVIPKYGKDDYDLWVNDHPRRNVPEEAGSLGTTHVHASILVMIFGDKFDFSGSKYQIKNSYIHFEGQDGDTIHMHATGVPLGFLFESMNIGITDACFVFPDGREFCTNDEHHLKFYVNGEQVDSLGKFVMSQNDRILISYGPNNDEQIKKEISELESQKIIG